MINLDRMEDADDADCGSSFVLITDPSLTPALKLCSASHLILRKQRTIADATVHPWNP
jgi:hypothetical protein